MNNTNLSWNTTAAVSMIINSVQNTMSILALSITGESPKKKVCYDIPAATGRGDYKPVLKQDIAKLEVIPDHQEQVIPCAEKRTLVVKETSPSVEIRI